MNEEMATVIRPDQSSKRPPCPACRGRGTKLCTSRRVLLVGASADDYSTGERECLDCLGDGLAEGSEQ